VVQAVLAVLEATVDGRDTTDWPGRLGVIVDCPMRRVGEGLMIKSLDPNDQIIRV
jgi:hypothetical protein